MKYLAVPFFGLMLAGVAVYAASLSGCGGSIGNEDMAAPPDLTVVSTYSCAENKMPPQCKEFTEISPNQSQSGLESLCTAALTPGACTRTNLLGGCRTKNPNYTFTTWFYSGGTMFSTSAQVQTYCGSAYVPPS